MLTEDLLPIVAKAVTVTSDGIAISYYDFMDLASNLNIKVSLKAFKPTEDGVVKYEAAAVKLDSPTKHEFTATATERFPTKVEDESIMKQVQVKAANLCIDANYPGLMEMLGGVIVWPLSHQSNLAH